jgi:hypothetical protein
VPKDHYSSKKATDKGRRAVASGHFYGGSKDARKRWGSKPSKRLHTRRRYVEAVLFPSSRFAHDLVRTKEQADSFWPEWILKNLA